MSSKKRTLKDSSRLNENGNMGSATKKIKMESIEDIKKEPVDEEQPFDPSNNPPEDDENVSTEPMKTEFKREPEDLRKTSQRVKCDICSELEYQKAMKMVKMEEERMVFVSMFPEHFVAVDKLNFFFKKKYARVCYSHVLEANDKIKKLLDKTGSIQKLLTPNFKSTKPHISIPGMECLLSKFLIRNQKRKKMPSTRNMRYFRCKVCNRQRPLEKISKTMSKTLKTALMIGCVLRETHSVDDAKPFCASGKLDPLCRSHFKKSMRQIFKFLEVEDGLTIPDASSNLMKDLMKTVNCLNEEMTVTKFQESIQELVKRVEPQKGPTVYGSSQFQCVICKRSKKGVEICQLSSKHVKTAVMVRCVLKGTHTLEDAQRMIMSEKGKHVCHEHFRKAIKTISKYLGIQNVQEIHDCSVASMTNLMETVNSLLPDMTVRQFKDAAIELAKKVEKFKEQKAAMQQFTETTTEPAEECESVQEEGETTCGVCQLQHPKEKFVTLKSKSSKMLIMFGCVTRGTHAIEDAKLFITSGKEERSCRKHLRKSKEKILSVLEIKDASAISICSESSMKKLMVTVNSLLPEMTASEFELAYARMAKKIEKFEEQRMLTTDE